MRLLPSRDFGRLASRQVGKLAGGKFGGLTVGSVGALSPTVVKLQNNRRPQGATLPSIHGTGDAGRGTGSGKLVGRQVDRSANRWVVMLAEKSRLTRMFALQKSLMFVATKVAPTANFVFHANFFGCSGEQPLVNPHSTQHCIGRKYTMR